MSATRRTASRSTTTTCSARSGRSVRRISMSTEPLVAADQLAEWRSELNALYAQMEDWLKEMELPPSVRRQPITVTELWSGPYQVDELVLTRNGRQREVRPIVRDILGA